MTSYAFNENKLYFVRDILVTVHRADNKYHVPLYDTDVPNKIKSITPKCGNELDGRCSILKGVVIEFDDSTTLELFVDIESGDEMIVSNFYELVSGKSKKAGVELIMEVDVHLGKKTFKRFVKEQEDLEKLDTADYADFRLEKILNIKV